MSKFGNIAHISHFSKLNWFDQKNSELILIEHLNQLGSHFRQFYLFDNERCNKSRSLNDKKG